MENKLTKEEKSEIGRLIERLIYHSANINACKRLVQKHKELLELDKLMFDKEGELLRVSEIIITELGLRRQKHEEVCSALAKKLIELCNLSGIFKEEEIAPFATSQLKKGFIELTPAFEMMSIINKKPTRYFIILNLGEIIAADEKNYEFYLTNAYPQIPKGFKILFN